MKLRRPLPEWFARSCLHEAKQGDPSQLIGHLCHVLHTGDTKSFSADELQFVVYALEAVRTKYGTDKLREIESFLITSQVEDIEDELARVRGARKRGDRKQAVDEVARHRGRSDRHIRSILRKARSRARRPYP